MSISAPKLALTEGHQPEKICCLWPNGLIRESKYHVKMPLFHGLLYHHVNISFNSCFDMCLADVYCPYHHPAWQLLSQFFVLLTNIVILSECSQKDSDPVTLHGVPSCIFRLKCKSIYKSAILCDVPSFFEFCNVRRMVISLNDICKVYPQFCEAKQFQNLSDLILHSLSLVVGRKYIGSNFKQ